MKLTKQNVKIEWDRLGEGMCGDYDPTDHSDVELLRFSVSVLGNKGEVKNQWIDPGDASYCTLFPASASKELQRKGLRFLMDEIFDEASQGHTIKKLCERLSWISPNWLSKQND